MPVAIVPSAPPPALPSPGNDDAVDLDAAEAAITPDAAAIRPADAPLPPAPRRRLSCTFVPEAPAPQRNHATRMSSLSANLSAVRRAQKDYRGPLRDADPARVRERPGLREGRPVDIFVYVLFKKVREIDIKQASVGVRFILGFQWKTDLAGQRVDEHALWTPKIAFLNNDKLNRIENDPTFYPESGEVRQVVTMDGRMSNEMDLLHFPWDFDNVSLLMVAEMDTADRNVRLFWQSARNIETSTPQYLDAQLPEWRLDPALNSMNRLPAVPGGLIGHFNGIEFSFYLQRHVGYFLIKILSVVGMLTSLSWTAFFIYEEAPSDYGGGNGHGNGHGNGTTHGGDDWPYTISQTAFVDRLNLFTGVLLACVAFQYLVGESLPKTGYMTTMDKLLMSSFVDLFLGALETFVARQLSVLGMHEEARLLDLVACIAVPCVFVMLNGYFIAKSWLKVTQDVRTTVSGVAPNLIIDNTAEVQLVVDQVGVTAPHDGMHAMAEAIDDPDAVRSFIRATRSFFGGGKGNDVDDMVEHTDVERKAGAQHKI